MTRRTALSLPAAMWAQQPQRPGGRGRRAPVPDDNTGFVPIFDGKTLNNWDGEPGFWRAEEGVIVGQTTPEKQLKLNTFLIWRGGTTADFELKAEYRITDPGNSGIQYRSVTLPEIGQWVMRGYQFDIDGKNMFTGQVYEERARGFVALRGQFIRMAEGGVAKLIGSPGDGDELKAVIKPDWNQAHILARGIVLTQVLNGRVMSMVVDEDPQGRKTEGLLGLQLHMGPPMKVEFRNILYRKL